MSLYLKLHNKIKKHADADWLTPTQKSTLIEIKNRMDLDELINLYGSHGSGKTFLCWMLSKLESATYAPDPLAYPSSGHVAVIIDNFGYFRKNDFREISAKYALKKVDKFIIITLSPFLEEQCVRIRMPMPTHEDIERIIANLLKVAPLLTMKCPLDSFSIWEIFRNLEVRSNGY